MSRREPNRSQETCCRFPSCTVPEYHLHCTRCGARLRLDQRLFCGDTCANEDRQAKRNALSVRCTVQPEDGNGAKLRRWIPRRILGRTYTGVSKPSGALGATEQKIGQGYSK